MSSVEQTADGIVSLNESFEFYNFVWEIEEWKRTYHQIKLSPTFKDVDDNAWRIQAILTDTQLGYRHVRIDVNLLQLGNPSEPFTGYIEIQMPPSGLTPQFKAGKVYVLHSPGMVSSAAASFEQPTWPANRVFCQFVMKKSGRSLKKPALSFRNLLSEESFADVKIISTEGNEFSAHKAILAARSRVFKAMLNAGMSEATTNEIHLTDFPECVVVGLLEFIYKDHTTVKSEYCEWLRIADMYELDGLKSLVETQLAQKLTSENAVSIFHIACVYGSPILKKKVSDFIRGNAKEISTTSAIGEFVKSNPEIIPELFKLVAGSG